MVQEKPDPYLDELQEMLMVNYRIQVSSTSIWCTLWAGGFTIKKIWSFPISMFVVATDLHWFSYHALHLSVWKKSGSPTWIKLVNILWNSSSLWMRAQLIAEQCTEKMLGLYVVHKHSTRPFSCVDDNRRTMTIIHLFLIPSLGFLSYLLSYTMMALFTVKLLKACSALNHFSAL